MMQRNKTHAWCWRLHRHKVDRNCLNRAIGRFFAILLCRTVSLAASYRAGRRMARATPQLSQKASPAITDTPQTGQAVVTTVGAGCGIAGADGAAVGIACSNFAPHSSQKAAPSGCCVPQFIHIGIDFLLLPPAALADRFAAGGDQFSNSSA